MCIATQKRSFEDVEKALGDALAGLTPYYAANHIGLIQGELSYAPSIWKNEMPSDN